MEDSKYHYSTIHEEGPEERVMFIRHPVDRIISAYNLIGGKKPFDEWLDEVLGNPMGDPHTWPQAEFIGPHNPKIMFISEMSSFLKSRQYTSDKINVSKDRVNLTPEQELRVNDVYSRDIDLISKI